MNPVTDNTTAQPVAAQTDVNDDLAKALASVQAGPQENMNFEPVGEPEVMSVPPLPSSPAPAVSADSGAPVAAASDDVGVAVEYSTPPANIDHSGDAVVSSGSDVDTIEQIKISALQQLRPLMQHIELSPEEKFEKYLMMLRASDDASLIEPTYQAAQQIGSEKLRAQALLDVINEINYLTSQQLVA
jgi:hypothetical protein